MKLASMWQERAPQGPWFVETEHDGHIFFGSDTDSAKQCMDAINRHTQSTESDSAAEQIEALATLQTTEEADIDFLLAQLGLNLDSVPARTAVCSFRKQIIIAAAELSR